MHCGFVMKGKKSMSKKGRNNYKNQKKKKRIKREKVKKKKKFSIIGEAITKREVHGIIWK